MIEFMGEWFLKLYVLLLYKFTKLMDHNEIDWAASLSTRFKRL